MEYLSALAVSSAILFLTPVISSFFLLYFVKPKGRVILGFGSGVILSYVFIKIVPDIYERNHSELFPILMLGGIFISLLFDKINFFKRAHLSEDELSCWKCEEPFRIDFSIALSLHYFLDGFFLGGFLISSESFAVSSIPVIAHKFVDGFILFISFSGYDKVRSMVRIMIVSLFNIVGLFFSYFSISIFSISDIFSPIAGGILIYVAIHDFIPALNSAKDFASFTLGALIIVLLTKLLFGH